LQLQRVWQSIAPNSDPQKLSGEVNLFLVWPSNQPQGSKDSGSIIITRLSWNGRLLSDRLEGSLELDKERITAHRILGTIAGAQIEAEAVWGLEEGDSRLLLVRARNLSIPFVAETAALPQDIIEGNCDVAATIIPGAVWQVDLRLTATQLTVMGVDVQSVSLPLRGTILPTLEQGELTLRSGAASFAEGRINGQVAVRWGGRRQLTGTLEFDKVDVKTLVQQSLGSDLPGDGHLSGTVTLEGSQIRNWADTAVVVDAKLGRCQPRQLPVIEAFESVARTISLSQPVEEGEIKARFAQNALSIQKLTLSGPTLEMQITGNVAANRRLNLTLILKTGRRSIDRRISHLVGGQLGNRLIGFLADRLIQASIQGTVDRPVVHVKPLSLISVKALQ
jgi:autotransporter translocation and assembly factor TamB